jgi:glyoxylase-like metal-dependent hydrolase (beta-lactamase superfamily II)
MTVIHDETIDKIKELGGISKIAISHAHYYGTMIEWSKAFDAPIYVHVDDRQWVVRPDDAVVYWEGETLPMGDGLTLIRCGGHFSGGQVLHWADGADGKGVLLTGDIINVVQDRRYVSFMYSYPNQIPMSAKKIRQIIAALEPYDYERVYSAWFGAVVQEKGKEAVKFSAERYIKAITD